MNIIKKWSLSFCLFVLLGSILTACTNNPINTQDGQIITTSPRDYLPTPQDLTNGSGFFIPENDAFILPNEMAVGAFGKDKGEVLVSEQERVTGWRVHYQANKADQPGPLVYLITITQHQSAKGAQTAVTKYNYALLYPDGGWKLDPNPAKIGDTTVIETGITEDQQGHKAMNYRIEFSYRNMSVDVLVYGLEKEVNLEMAKKLAQAVVNRLHTAPLGKGPIQTPTLAPAVPN